MISGTEASVTMTGVTERTRSDCRDLLPAPAVLARLPDSPAPAHAEVRAFCLAEIKRAYGFDHRPDWHADLDSLLAGPAANQYSTRHGGAFWAVRDQAGQVVASAGFRRLGWKPGLVRQFRARYGTAEDVATLCRVYVRPDRRRQGLGAALASLAEAEAGLMGYRTMYLHAGSDAAAALAFWQAAGYREICAEPDSTHFDKPLAGPDTVMPPC